MPRMIIAFHADNDRIGTTVDMDDDTARIAVREGRARYADDEQHAPATEGAAPDPSEVTQSAAPGLVEP